MNKFKEWYLKIICYDPIIDSLNKASPADKKEVSYFHSASPVKPNRKQKRQYIQKAVVYLDDNRFNSFINEEDSPIVCTKPLVVNKGAIKTVQIEYKSDEKDV